MFHSSLINILQSFPDPSDLIDPGIYLHILWMMNKPDNFWLYWSSGNEGERSQRSLVSSKPFLSTLLYLELLKGAGQRKDREDGHEIMRAAENWEKCSAS
jgi:hypothetical protein